MVSSTNVNSKPAYRWVILLLTWLIYVSFGLITSTLAAIVSQVMYDLNLSYSQMGFILGSWPLVYIVVSIPFGFLTDHLGPYKTLLLATIIIAVSAILRSLALNFESLTVSVAVFGVGGSLISIGIPKVASMWFLGKERGTASGIYTTGLSMGNIMALSLTNSIVIPLVGNWRNAYLIYGLVGFLISGLWMFLGHRQRSSSWLNASSKPIKSAGFEGIKKVLKSRNVWLVVIIGVTCFATGLGISNWLPKILELKGMTITEVSLATSFLNVIGIFGTIMIPRLPYLLGSKKISISILLCLQGIAILGIGVLEVPMIWFTLTLYGLTSGLVPLLIVLLMDLPEVGPLRMGLVAGLFFAIGQLGGFGGPFIVGLLKDLTGTFFSGMLFLSIFCEAVITLAVILKVDAR